MRQKLCLILTLILLASCNISQRKEAKKIINDFKKHRVPDQRETLFNLSYYFKKGTLIIEGETDSKQLKKELLSKLTDLPIVDRFSLLPDSSLIETPFGLVNLSVSNFRSQPKQSAELSTQALLGTPIKLLKIEDGWWLVQTPDKYISWVDQGGIYVLPKEEYKNWQQADRVIFTGIHCSIYQTPKLKESVSDVVMGNIMQVLEQSSGILKVEFPDGRVGYTSKRGWIDFDKFKSRKDIRPEQLTKVAKQLTGRPYLWGGTSVNAMDCSGFVKIIYFMNGLILARDASLQFRHGKAVEANQDYNNFQVGDLLFFGKKRVTHVGLSLAGSTYIHASGRVKYNSFDTASNIFSEYRRNSFIGAKRVIGYEGTDGIQLIGEHPWY